MDPEIFDDLDFYHPLLKDLVERRQIDIPVGVGEWTKQGKGTAKNGVKDTRASKGRKLRYHEHEKIQNFMAPVQVGTWHEDQIEYHHPKSIPGLILVNCLRACWGDIFKLTRRPCRWRCKIPRRMGCESLVEIL